MEHESRRANLARTRTWAAFEQAAREALAAGNEPSLLLHTLREQEKVIEDARDALWVRDV